MGIRNDGAALIVKIIPPASLFRPIDDRKYTFLIDSNKEKSYLSIGYQIDYLLIDESRREEILGTWKYQRGQYILALTALVSDENIGPERAGVRYEDFSRKMDSAINAIINGDSHIFDYFPWLLDAPIYVHFESNSPKHAQTVYYGKPRHFLTKTQRKHKVK